MTRSGSTSIAVTVTLTHWSEARGLVAIHLSAMFVTAAAMSGAALTFTKNGAPERNGRGDISQPPARLFTPDMWFL